MKLKLASFILFVFPLNARALTIQTVFVGNPGNPADTAVMECCDGVTGSTGYGAVQHSYRIARTEVTNAQYVEFLNAVAKSDPYDLFSAEMSTTTWGGITRGGSSGSFVYSVKSAVPGQGPNGTDYTYSDKPAVFINWYNAARFANWMHNGQGAGDTETGAYTLGGTTVPVGGIGITRNANARWFLPSANEWYKAAYYDGHSGTYYRYPMGDSATPNNNLPSADTGNSGNFRADGTAYTTGNLNYPFTDVGAYTLSASPNGTFDQGGNVFEWTEAVHEVSWRGLRGGSWTELERRMASTYEWDLLPTSHQRYIGFRLAAIPEPASAMLLTLAAASALARRRRSPSTRDRVV